MGQIVNAFTCTGAYAVLIMTGLKRVENRSAVPCPLMGRCAVTVSRSFRRGEFDNLLTWLRDRLPEAIYAMLPTWDDVKGWPGHVVGTIDYSVKDSAACSEDELLQRRIWNENYPCWWHLANPKVFNATIPCRGNVGMWRLPPDLAAAVSRYEKWGQSPDEAGQE